MSHRIEEAIEDTGQPGPVFEYVTAKIGPYLVSTVYQKTRMDDGVVSWAIFSDPQKTMERVRVNRVTAKMVREQHARNRDNACAWVNGQTCS